MKPKAPPKLNPGDEARSGKNARGEKCRNCGGTGKIVRGVGGA